MSIDTVPARKPRRKEVAADVFVRAWQASASLAALAAVLGMDKHGAEVRAYKYRKRGVPLKKFNRRKPVGRVVDWSGLRSLAIACRKGVVAS